MTMLAGVWRRTYGDDCRSFGALVSIWRYAGAANAVDVRIEERQTVSFLHTVEKFGATVGGWAKLAGAFGEVFCLSCVWNS